VGEHAVDIVKLSACERFLRLNQFNTVGHACLHSVIEKARQQGKVSAEE
jgi:hypothetical protein